VEYYGALALTGLIFAIIGFVCNSFWSNALGSQDAESALLGGMFFFYGLAILCWLVSIWWYAASS